MVIPALFTASGAVTTQQNAITVISNNIANVNTTGFKVSRVHFSEEISNLLNPSSSATSTRGGSNPIEVGTGIRLSDVNTQFSQGSLRNTGLSSDLALSGDGFFVVSSATTDDAGALENPQYTRDGHFMVDSEQNLVAADGSKVMGAFIYDHLTGRIKDVDGYSNITYFTDQTVGPTSSPDYSPNDGLAGNPAAPVAPTHLTITDTNGAAATFNTGNLAEISIRGGVVDQNTSVNTTTNGDLVVSRQSDGKMVFTFDDANAGTAASTFTAAVDTTQQILNNVLSFEMSNTAGDKIQMRLRLEPGVTSIEDVFSNIDYDAGTATSDSVRLLGGAATTQSGSRMTVGDEDLEFLSLSDVRSLSGPVKLPNFFYLQDNNLEVETSNYSIGSDGSLSIFGTSSEELKLGRLFVANFTNPDGLNNAGGNRFVQSSNSGVAAVSVIGGPFDKNAPSFAGTKIVAGALEASNVNIADEFAEMIRFQRGLQANARSISTADEVLQTLINL